MGNSLCSDVNRENLILMANLGTFEIEDIWLILLSMLSLEGITTRAGNVFLNPFLTG